jgi:PAS domain S-box-containing protein
MLFDHDLRILLADGRGLTAAGLERGNMVGKAPWEIFPKETREVLEPHCRATLQGKSTVFEIAFAGRLHRAHTVPVPGHDGIVISGMIMTQDITDRKQVQEALEKERNLLQEVMNGAKKSNLVYLDREFNFVRVNSAYAGTCGYKPEEMIGKNHFALYPHPGNEAIFTRVRDTGKAFEIRDKPFEFPDQPERGTTYWDWTLTPVKDNSGQVIGLVFSLFETTDRKRAEEALLLEKNDLQKAIAEIKTLRGILPICSICKQIRDDKGYWKQIETYIREHSEADISHGICPACARKHYPDYDIYPE